MQAEHVVLELGFCLCKGVVEATSLLLEGGVLLKTERGILLKKHGNVPFKILKLLRFANVEEIELRGYLYGLVKPIIFSTAILKLHSRHTRGLVKVDAYSLQQSIWICVMEIDLLPTCLFHLLSQINLFLFP
jgi:hypothetical protein